MTKRTTFVALAAAALIAGVAADPAAAVDPQNYNRVSSSNTDTRRYDGVRYDGVRYDDARLEARRAPTTTRASYQYDVDPTFGYDPLLQPTPTFGSAPGNLVSSPDNWNQDLRGRSALPYTPPADGVSTLGGSPTVERKANQWRIGIRSRDTDHGVRVIQVLPGSPADVARLEPNDVIVAVGGYQVGRVNGRRFDLGSEFDQRCDENGTTFLLVQNNRDRSLVTMDVQLEPRFSKITGEVVWKSERRLPQDSYAHVELREVVRRGAPPIVLAEKLIYGLKQTHKTGRAPFEIEYDPKEINVNRMYTVHCQIFSDTHTIYEAERPYPVITNNNPRTAVMQMVQTYDWYNPQHTDVNEANREWDQFVTLYRRYMGRDLRAEQEYAYRNHFDRGYHIDEALVDVIGSEEFYQRCNKDDRQFISTAFQMRKGRRPTEQEVQFWLAKLEESDNMHRPFSRQMLSLLD